MKLYIGFVNRLQRDLLDLAYTDFDTYTARIEKLFLDFMKKSTTAYQKTQFLVGKELAAVKDTLAKFYTFQKDFRKKNEHLITTTQTLAAVQAKMDKVNQTQESCKEVQKNITTLATQIKKLQEHNKKLSTTLQQTKESKDYIANKQKEKELEVEKVRLKNEYANLRRMIDFKALASEFHASPKYMDVVKAYRDDFVAQVETDGGMALQSLLREARQYNGTISTQLKKIKELSKELRDKEASIKDDELEPLHAKIQATESELTALQKQKGQQTTSHENLKKARENMIDSIQAELEQLGVVVE